MKYKYVKCFKRNTDPLAKCGRCFCEVDEVYYTTLIKRLCHNCISSLETTDVKFAMGLGVMEWNEFVTSEIIYRNRQMEEAFDKLNNNLELCRKALINEGSFYRN